MRLTDKAVEQISRIKRIKKAAGFVRVRAQKRDENRWLLEMGFDEERAGDVNVETGGLTVVMDKTTWMALKGAVVDFEKSGGKGSFIIIHESS